MSDFPIYNESKMEHRFASAGGSKQVDIGNDAKSRPMLVSVRSDTECKQELID
jgi:hypothetical protein